jgi:hypothetical protein
MTALLGTFMKRVAWIALLAGAAPLFAGCFIIAVADNYTLIDTTQVIDPQTGDIIQTSTWKYEDGDVVTTTDVFSPGGQNQDRRTEPAARQFHPFD